jgi:amino acid transporter
MVPISGSAYTYAYATLGELIAWIIGWDLIIEYAIGNTAVAISWANYFRTLLETAGIIFRSGWRPIIAPPPRSPVARVGAALVRPPDRLQSAGVRHRVRH